MNATPDTERHQTLPSVRDLTPDELYRRLIEALRVSAFATAAEREAFFGEPVHVTERGRSEAERELRRQLGGGDHTKLQVERRIRPAASGGSRRVAARSATQCRVSTRRR